MSTPFINPYETKDVVATSLNNLDKQSQNIISYLDGLFSSETVKDKQLILDNGTVETLKPFQVANSQGAFWDKGTTYYFQPVADRLREISLEIQGKLNPTDISNTLKAGIAGLFSKTLDDSRKQISADSTDQYADTWTYEQWYTNTSDPDNPINSTTTLDDFLNAIGTAAFTMVNAAADENPATKAITSTSGLINLDSIAKLLDDGDNFYNDDNTLDDPSTTTVTEGADSNKQPEFYLIGNRKLPVFGAVEDVPNHADTTKYPGGTANAVYKQDLYNYQNKRIDPNNKYWNDTSVLALQKKPEEVFYNMVAIAITQQKVGKYSSSAPSDIRTINDKTAEDARNSLKNIAGNYFKDSQAWYDSGTPRNLDANTVPKPPSFLLSKSKNGEINYNNYDGSYGAFKATDTGTLGSLIFQATGINATEANAIIANWNWNGTLPAPAGINALTFSDNVDKITKYYTQSYISASITSTFGKKDSAISTKSFLIHEALNNLDPSQNPYLEEAGDKDVVKFDKLLADTSGYLRSAQDPANNQMMKLMDLFLENFDITANRYVEDKRTLVDLFSGKLPTTTGKNAEVQKSLFQNVRSATKDISSQIKNTLTRGVPESAESQFTLDLFNQTAVRKEDYGLSPNPEDSTKNFLPSSWANNKDKYLPAMYYYNKDTTHIITADEANNTLNSTNAKNGLPAGFPIMDVRDFDQFFKATKLALTNHIMNYLNTGGASFIASNNLTSLYNEMGAFLTDPNTITTYPSWGDTGFATGSQAAIFGTLDLSPTGDKTNFSRAIQLYKSLDKIIDNMKDRVSSLEQSVPKIPRPINPIITVIDPITNLPLPPVTLTLQSTIAGYGDKASPALVKSFLEMHEDTKGPAISVDANAESLQRISYLINTFDDYSKFSQNSAFEGIYAGEVFEADKQNFSDLNTKKPEPSPDGSIPEDKSVPKPLMAALSSSVLVTKLGQILTNKVNDLVQENNVISIDTVTRKDGSNTNIGKIDTTTLSGSKESQTYLNNILKQISSLSGQNLIDVSAIGALISDQMEMETAMQTLITDTDNDNYRMVFIDNETIGELISLRNTLYKISTLPGKPMNDLKQLLSNADLDNLQVDTYPAINAGNNAPGYRQYSSLTLGQKKLIDDIRDKKFIINGSTTPPTYTINGVSATLPPTELPDAALNTLGDLAMNIRSMLYSSSQQEKPPRIISPADTPDLFPIINKFNDAKIDFANLTNGGTVSYNAILNADVYEVGLGPTFTVTGPTALNSHPNKNAITLARKNLLEELLYEKKIGGISINNLNKTNSLNPYHTLLNPTTYSALDPNGFTPKFPALLTVSDKLGSITNKADFKKHIENIDTFITGFKDSLNAATLETPPRNIDPTNAINNTENDPIVALREKAKFNFTGIDSIIDLADDPLNAAKRTAIKNALINSKVGSENLANYGTLADRTEIKNARTKLLEFFLEGQPIDDPANPLPVTTTGLSYPASYTLNDITGHLRYKDLITPTTYTYPSNSSITDPSTGLISVAKSEPIALNGTVNNSKADSFTLREIMGCDKSFTGGDVAFRNNAGEYLKADGNIIPTGTNPPYDTTIGFPDSLNDLEFKMRNVTGEFSTANKQLYIRKMQHFNVLFNTLSGGTTKNPQLDTFIAPPQLFGSGTKNLKQYIESLASDTKIINSSPFQKILTQVTNLTPITENINALEVSLAGEIKKPKSGPESEIYSTIHLLTQIENQTGLTPPDYEAGIIQLLNTRKIKDDSRSPAIDYLEHRAAATPKDGLYQYSGYDANKQYLSYDSTKPPTDPRNSVTGRNIAPDTSAYPNEGWNIQALLATKTSISPPFTTLADAQEYLSGLNEVYKDMQESKSPVIKEQLKVFDLWLRNNSFSPISDSALKGKDSLEADINILNHIEEGAIAITLTTPAGKTPINYFLEASKTAAVANKKSLEDLNDIKTAGKGFAQRIDDGLTATELRNYFQENIFYPSSTPFPKAGSADTRVNLNKDYFGRILDNSNIPVFGVNIFGTDNNTTPPTTYTVPPDIQTHYATANSTGVLPTVPPAPAIPAAVGSNSFKNFGTISAGLATLSNPYQKIMDNINTLLTALAVEETAGHYNKVNLYKTMIKNLLGESSEAPKAALITLASAEPATSIPLILPASLAGMGLTYGTNNYPSTNLKTKILEERQTINEAINPAKYTGTQPIPKEILANFALSSKADQPTTIRSVGVEGKSIQELAILLYIMQMFEQSNWDFEKYINDTSRYEMEAAVE